MSGRDDVWLAVAHGRRAARTFFGGGCASASLSTPMLSWPTRISWPWALGHRGGEGRRRLAPKGHRHTPGLQNRTLARSAFRRSVSFAAPVCFTSAAAFFMLASRSCCVSERYVRISCRSSRRQSAPCAPLLSRATMCRRESCVVTAVMRCGWRFEAGRG